MTWAEPKQLALLEDHIFTKFVEFHAQNPAVYKRLRILALEWKDAGNDHGSINMLFEVIRHQDGLATRGSQWKLDNDMRAEYARLLMANEPDLRGFFEVRQLRRSA
jgi:hypothetical protein